MSRSRLVLVLAVSSCRDLESLGAPHADAVRPPLAWAGRATPLEISGGLFNASLGGAPDRLGELDDRFVVLLNGAPAGEATRSSRTSLAFTLGADTAPGLYD